MSNYFLPIRLTPSRCYGLSAFFFSFFLLVLSETLAHSQCAPAAPAAPTGLLVIVGSNPTSSVTVPPSVISCGALYLTWEKTSDDEEGFALERLVDGGLDTTFPVKPNKISFTDTEVVTGKSYCYRMRSFNSVGASGVSNETCATAVYPLASLTPTPGSTIAGGAINVSWSGITNATATDWIGLYVPGSADTEFIDWIYVSCSKTAATPRASGSCSYTVPSTLAAGNYELRIFLRDVFFRLSTNKVLSVTTQTAN